MKIEVKAPVPPSGPQRSLAWFRGLRLEVAGLIRVCIALGCLHTFALGLEIKEPPGWLPQYKLPPGIILQAVSPDTATSFRSNLLVTRGKLPCCREESTTSDSLMAKVSHQQARILPMYKVLEKRKRKLDGREGGFLVSSYAQGANDLACLQFFYLDGQDFVNVVYTCPLKDLPRLRPDIEKSLQTLKTKEPAEPAPPAKQGPNP